MKTAEEFFRNKIKEQNPNIEIVNLSQELITAEQGVLWAHEFKQLHLHAVSSSAEYTCGYKDGWRDCVKMLKSLEKGLTQFIINSTDDDSRRSSR